jgi:hypothetical protein
MFQVMPLVDDNYTNKLTVNGEEYTTIDVAHRFKVFFSVACSICALQIIVGLIG